MVVRIQRVHESNVRAHDVPAILAEKRWYQAETVKSHIRRVEGSKHREVGQIAEQADLAEDWEALFDQVGPALALAMGVGLLEQVAAACVEDVVADGCTETLVLRPELI